VLTVSRLHGDAAYYRRDLSGPQLQGPSVTGAAGHLYFHARREGWRGSAAARLGLAGPVDPEALDALLARCHPETGRSLVSRRGAVAGFDLTFSVPKSVSVLFALGGEEVGRAVARAHGEAVEGALGYLEAHAAVARRGRGDRQELLATGGLVAAAFPHVESRSLDPHLHTHVVVANLAHGDDGRWSALDGRGLDAHRRAAGAVHDAHLRHALRAAVGVDWVPNRRGGFEIDGIDPVLLGAFSGRRAEIAADLAAQGFRGVRAGRIAWASTRQPKSVPAPEVLVERWADVAADVGAGPVVRAVSRRHGEVARSGDRTVGNLDEHRFAAALSEVPSGAPARRDVVAAWAGALRAGAPAPVIDGVVDGWLPAGGGRGVDEERVAVRQVVPRPELLASLGPRPGDLAGSAAWREAAAAIDGYRSRWGISGAERPFAPDRGARTAGLAALPARQLADHLRVDRVIDRARGRVHVRSADGRGGSRPVGHAGREPEGRGTGRVGP
jgi:conjugative relaxase-like TrwC/TraI family protein